MAAECVKVIVRCRPMNEREDKLSCKSVISMESKVGQCAISNPKDKKAPPKSFTFDGSYFVDSTTEQIYNDIGYPLVEGVTEGYNGTIFAYGQTGCGKSFSMQGITDPATQRGIIPRAFDHIFETVSVVEGQKFLIHASYLEIYNEDIRDLLGKDTKSKLDIKEHPDKGVYVHDLTMHPVHNVRECEKIMERGWKNRSTGATLMNNDSSRSHSIFTINMEMTTTDEEGEDHIRVGKLNLVDLAGSERQAKTGATGDRLKEATKINLSLSALGNVISALVDGKSKHIPYRDSKLTRLLQDSLGGNTKTLMVACISPADNNYEESLSTLRYANRAKNIKNKPKINEDPKDALLREYQEEIQKLKAMLMGQMPIPDGGFSGVDIAQVKANDKPTKATSNAEVTRLHEELELEKDMIRQEFDSKLDDMKAMYEEEKENKTKLEDGMLKLRQFYDDKLHSVDSQIASLPPTAAVLGEVEWSVNWPQHRYDESERSGSESSREYPESSMDKTAPESRDETMNILSVMSLTDDMDNDSEGTVTPKRAIHVRTTPSENTDIGILAPTSSPTGPPDLFKLQHDEALKRKETTSETQDHKDVIHRLQELQQQMVGGENIDNSEVKERHKKRKEFAEERKMDLAKAIENMDDDGIMLQIYDNVQDELKAKNAQLIKEREKVEGYQSELTDVQSEFQTERDEYLKEVRKLEQELSLVGALLDRIQPCVRRDCNYSNLDKIRAECQWDADASKWTLPKIIIEKTALPSGSIMPGAQPQVYNGVQYRNGEGMNGYEEEDRLKEKINRNDVSNRYFQAKKSQLRQAQEIGQINMQEIRETFAPTDNTPYTNGNSYYDEEPISNELKAAQVHGTLAPEEGLMRRPMKLESLQSQKVRKSKKKKNALDPL